MQFLPYRSLQAISNVQEVIEKLSLKIGLIILILGAMHFFNLYIFFVLRKKAIIKKIIVQSLLTTKLNFEDLFFNSNSSNSNDNLYCRYYFRP